MTEVSGIPNIAIAGTGAVGEAILTVYKKFGFPVKGYDVNEERIQRLQAEGLPVHHMSEFEHSQADIVFVCVGTPQGENGAMHTEYILSALDTIGRWIPSRHAQGRYPVIAIRSTMFPGLCQSTMLPALESASGMAAGTHFGFQHVPEQLRESDREKDAEFPWSIVIGGYDAQGTDILLKFFKAVLTHTGNTEVPIRVTSVFNAEAAKFIMNVRNATRISLTNTWGLMLNQMGESAQEAIDLSVILGEETNVWYGTVAGAPYGGACLPKEVAMAIYMGKQLGVDVSLLEGVQHVNQTMLDRAAAGEAMRVVIHGYRRKNAKDLLEGAIRAAQELAESSAPPAEDEI